MTDKTPVLVMAATICAGLCLTAAAAFLIGLEYDEAWIIAAHLGVFHPDAMPALSPVLTTGGLHMLIVGGLGEPGPAAVALARGLSFASLVLLLALIERAIRPWIPELTARLIVLAMVVATPGTLLLGGMGYGVVPATLLLLSGFFFWIRFEGPTLVRISVTGLLFGLAIATRWTFVPLVALMVLAGAVLSADIRHRWFQGALTTALALVMFSGFVLWHSGSVGPSEAATDQADLGASAWASGIVSSLPRPARITGFASRFVTLTSFPIILATLAAAIALRTHLPDSFRRTLLALCAAGLVIALAWTFRSPFLHARYIWPAVLMLNIAAGLMLAYLYISSQHMGGNIAHLIRMLCIAIPVGMAIESYMISVRLIAAGAGSEINHAGYGVQENHFKAFRLRKEQRAITAFLRAETTSDDRVAGFGLPPAWGEKQISLLSQRKVGTYNVDEAPAATPDILITHDFARVSDYGWAWLDAVSDSEQRVYGYRVYKINPKRFTRPDPTALIRNEVFRFSVPAEQSLSGR